ncbi:MAG: DUF1993 domain-containing protein [Deltaproteobacteria bacterium]|nr:DUF1993 domain-containing protein [Deltaproteobacteria bacterium]
MSMYDETVPEFLRTLTAMEAWIDEAHAYAEERGFESDVLLTARLSPDQYDVTRNIQSAADTAKLTAQRICGVKAPTHEDGPSTWEKLRARIAEVKEYLEGLDPAAFADRDDVIISPSMLRGGRVVTKRYVRGFGLPNFYFHCTTTYAILRANGVKLGKRAFLGSLPILPPAE